MFQIFTTRVKKSGRNTKSDYRRFRLESLEDRALLAVMAGLEAGGGEAIFASAQPTSETVVVTTLNDTVNAADGLLSLREAVIFANANAGTVITFDASLAGGTIQLDPAFMTDSSVTSEMDHLGALYITNSMTIDAGDLGITVSGQNQMSVIAMTIDSTITVDISGLTVTQGRNFWEGGGIFIDGGGGTVNLTNCVISNNAVIQDPAISCNCNGGGIAVHGGAALNITYCQIVNNTAQTSISGKIAYGGGIWNNVGTLTMIGSTLDGNTASASAGNAYGGGISFTSGTGSSITDCVISNNTVTGNNAFGGGFSTRSAKELWVRDSTITGNKTQAFGFSAVSYGGGFYSGNTEGAGGGATLWFYNTDISENTATTTKAQYGRTVVAWACGGGFHNNDNILRMYDCTVSGNSVTGAAQNVGGGLYNTNYLYMHNATITGNFAGAMAETRDFSYGGGVYNNSVVTVTFFNSLIADNAIFTGNATDAPCGAGIYNQSGMLIYDSTITGNEITAVSGVESFGAGVYDAGALTVFGSILVGNTATSGSAVSDSDAYSATETETSALKLLMSLVNYSANGSDNFQIIYSHENTDGIVIESTNYTPGTPLFTDAAAGDYTLAEGSAAINMGDMTTYLSYRDQNLDYHDTSLYDLRGTGYFRVVNDIIDYGCYEAQGTTPVFEVTIEGYTGVYDEAAHGVTLSGLAEGDLVYYSADGETYDTAPLLYTDAGTYTVYVKVTREGYVDWTGSADVAISTRSLATPDGLTVISAGANRKTVAWNSVAGAAGYTVAYSADQTNWTEIAASEASVMVTGLTYGSQVSFMVKALGTGNDADSEFSAAVASYVCPMDIDSDGRIGPADRSALSAAWFTRSTSAAWDGRADIDADGFVGPTDRNFLSLNWMKSATSTSLVYPEAKADAVFADADAEELDFSAPSLDIDFDFFD